MSAYDVVMSGISGLVGRWTLDDTSGTTAAAATGTAGAYVGSPTLAVTGLAPDGGTGVQLDGNTQEITVPVSPTQPVGSVIIWWKSTTDAGTIFRDNTSAAGTGWRMDVSGTNPIVRAAGTEHTVSAITSASVTTGTAKMFVVTTDGTTVKLYVNGSQVDSWAKTGNFGMSSPMHLGRNGTNSGTGAFYGGVWDEVAYFSTTVSAADIAALYAAVPGQNGTVSLAAVSTLTAAAVQVQTATAGLTATSVLTATAARGTVATVPLVSTSTLTATGDRVRSVAVSLTATSTLTATGSINATTPYPTAVLADSPRAYYRMGETAGATTMVDSSGNARNGTYQNGPTLGATGLLPPETDTNTAMSTVVGYGEVAYGSWMNVSNVTLEIMARPGAGVHDYALWTRDGADNGPPVNRTFLLRFYQGSVIEFIFWTTSGAQYSVSTPVTPGGRTFHVVATYDSTTAKLYIDGTLRNFVTVTSAPDPLYSANTTVPLNIGVLDASGGHFQYFNGTLDEAAFYGTALSATRVGVHATAAHAAAKTGTAAGAYAWAGTAAGVKPRKGTAAGAYAYAGSATGAKPTIVTHEGTAGTRVEWIGTGRGSRTRGATGAGGYRWHGAAVGGVAGPVGQTPTLHWTLTDKATGETWTMPTNPNSMTGLPRIKQLVTASYSRQNEARLRTFQGATVAQTLEWSGVILTAAHYQDLLTWADKSGVIVVTDHLQRSFEVIIQSFTPETKAGRRFNDPKRTYTMSTLFLRRLP